MKGMILIALNLVLMVSAYAERDPVFGTLTTVDCKNVVAPGKSIIVLTSERIGGFESATVAMNLLVDIELNGTLVRQSFKVSKKRDTYAYYKESKKIYNRSESGIVLSGVSQNGDKVRLIITNDEEQEEYNYSAMYINGKEQGHLKLVCKAPLAG